VPVDRRPVSEPTDDSSEQHEAEADREAYDRQLAEFAATVAYCEWENGEWPDDDDMRDARSAGLYIAHAVLHALHDGTARGFDEWRQRS
jgi:hypothetical protein